MVYYFDLNRKVKVTLFLLRRFTTKELDWSSVANFTFVPVINLWSSDYSSKRMASTPSLLAIINSQHKTFPEHASRVQHGVTAKTGKLKKDWDFTRYANQSDWSDFLLRWDKAARDGWDHGKERENWWHVNEVRHEGNDKDVYDGGKDDMNGCRAEEDNDNIVASPEESELFYLLLDIETLNFLKVSSKMNFSSLIFHSFFHEFYSSFEES